MNMLEEQSIVKVTVVCLTYNHEKYIGEALKGFVRQRTNFKYEIIVHDDASTDGTAAVIREYERMYPDIIRTIYQKENQLSKRRDIYYDYILPIVQGEFIALCEGDDYWTDPLKLQKQYDFMISHPNCSLVVHSTKIVYMNKRMKCLSPKFFNSLNACDLSAEDIIKNHSMFHTSSLFFRKVFFFKNEGFLKHHMPYDYLLKCLLATEGNVHFIPGKMSVYRVGTTGAWTQRITQCPEEYIHHFETAIKTMEDLNEYRSYLYDEAVRQNILNRKFNILLQQKDYSTIMKEPYLTIYRKLSMRGKAKIWIGKVLTELYEFIFG